MNFVVNHNNNSLPLQTVGIKLQDEIKLKAVALMGDSRSGITTYLFHILENEMYPWWKRPFFPPRGVYLTSNFERNIDEWLREELSVPNYVNPWFALGEMIQERRKEQLIRRFLHRLCKDKLPNCLRPQPVTIVIDDAEELLRKYRSKFLTSFTQLAIEANDENLIQFIVIINSENAKKALEMIYGGRDLFTFLQVPKISRQAVVAHYGEDFAKIFDDCDGNIGLAQQYFHRKKMNNSIANGKTAKDYILFMKEIIDKDRNLVEEITEEEYRQAEEHWRK
jgi:hypothetical protein